MWQKWSQTCDKIGKESEPKKRGGTGTKMETKYYKNGVEMVTQLDKHLSRAEEHESVEFDYPYSVFWVFTTMMYYCVL